MTQSEQAVLAAWEDIYPALESNPAELRRRLARRQQILARPPRDVCLVLRAADTRLDPFLAGHYRRDADEATWRWHAPYAPKPHAPPSTSTQRLRITAPLVRALCRPISGLYDVPIPLAAYHLGVHPRVILKILAREKRLPKHLRTFTTRDGRGEVGIVPWNKKQVAELHALGLTDLGCEQALKIARGRKRTLLRSTKTFDPNARGLASPRDRGWAAAQRDLHDKIPDDFAQPLTRTRAPTSPTAPHRRPATEHKPGTGHGALGTSPAPQDASPTPNTKSRIPNPTPWHWQCPICGQHVKKLYLPMPVFSLPQYFSLETNRPAKDALPRRPQLFACARCHNIDKHRTFSTTHGWDLLVAAYSGALLYGHEVPLPKDWLDEEHVGKRSLRPPTNQQLAINALHHQIATRVRNREPTPEIAKALNLTLTQLRNHTYAARKKGILPPAADLPSRPAPRTSPKRDEVARRLLAGETTRQIAQALNLNLRNIQEKAYMARVKGLLPWSRTRTTPPAPGSRTRGGPPPMGRTSTV